MSDYEIGDERIMLYVGVEFSEDRWVDKGEVVRCEDCVNWEEPAPGRTSHWCPVVRRHPRSNDWCCWGAREEADDER